MNARTSWMGVGVGLAMLAVACSGSGKANGRLAVSAKTVAPAGAAASEPVAGGLALGDGIVLTRLRIAVQGISLEGAAPASEGTMGTASMKEGESGGGDGGGGGGDGSDDGAEADDADEVTVGSFAVDLSGDALSGGIHPVLDAGIPAGTYRELRIDVGPVAGAAPGSALDAMAGRSVIIEGTIDGAPFTFESTLASERKVETTVQVSADGSTGVTLTIDPHGWFRGAGGRLDPGSSADRAAIEANVRASIGAEVEDENEHENEDEGGGAGGADDGAGHT